MFSYCRHANIALCVQDPWPSDWNSGLVFELKGEMKEMQEKMKEMQEKLVAQETIITEMNRTIAESTQNTNPGQNPNLQQNRIGKGSIT